MENAMKKRHATSSPILLNNKRDVPPEDLLLDNENPRLTGQPMGLEEQDELLAYLWKEKEVAELVQSIASNGYWAQELLFAVEEDGRLVVVEGNRRLAAVQLLRSPERCDALGIKGVPRSLPAAVARTLGALPVIVCSRKDLWQYMSFKHLNGPQEWDSIAKAQYVKRVYDEFGIPLDVIADTIGDRHETVKRLFHGLRILDQAENSGVFSKEERWPSRRFAYSHLWTALGYSSVRRFLGLRSDTMAKASPVPKEKLGDLGLFLTWVYGNKERSVRPLVKTQNPDLSDLAGVMETDNGLAALRRGLPLDVCVRQSRGDTEMLREALVDVESGLRQASAYVATGYDGEKDTYALAAKIGELAQDIVERMGARQRKAR
jgi:hypothetical protein